MPSRSHHTEALVLKRISTGEADRVITLLTQDQGKITCIAKGVRKLTSSKRAFLEPGNLVKCLMVGSHGMPILTQATLIDDCLTIHSNLSKLRQLMQVLEMLDALCVEEENDPSLFEEVLAIRSLIVQPHATPGTIRDHLNNLVELLGYQPHNQTQYATFHEYVSVIADRKMKSWEYLAVKGK
jgi:DNA repair protein RecO (recombination protein O)